VAYRVGARQANTSLRLRDGETQVLAGLIRDEDTKSVAGVPGLSALPWIGWLFGKHTDERNKSEIVLLITPHVVRNLGLPDSHGSNTPAGVETNPGLAPLRLARNAAVKLAAGSGSNPAPIRSTLPDNESPDTPEAERTAVLVLSTSGQVDAGGAAAVTLQNRSTVLIRGELSFDPQLLAATQAGTGGEASFAFELSPGAERVVVLRALPAAAGKTVNVSVGNVLATMTNGDAVAVRVDGDGALQVGKP
jgi:general secretion pathway protein D